MPEVLPKSFLDDEEARDPIFASGQYWCSVLSEKGQEFRSEWFRYYLEDEVPVDIKNYILVDPAISLKSSADYTAIMVVSVDILNNIFIRVLIRARMTPDELIYNLYQLHYTFKPFKIGIESNGFQILLKWAIDKEAKYRGRLPVFPIMHYKRSKDTRIRALIPAYREGRIWHKALNKEQDEVHTSQQILESELLLWIPNKTVAHDDCPDTLAQITDLVQIRKKKRPKFAEYYIASDQKTGY